MYDKWTVTAKECYDRNCICEGCYYAEQLETKCVMKKCVWELLKTSGEPPEIIITYKRRLTMKNYEWDYMLQIDEDKHICSGFTIKEENNKYLLKTVKSYGDNEAEKYKTSAEFFIYYLQSVIDNKEIDTYWYECSSYEAIQELIDIITEQYLQEVK